MKAAKEGGMGGNRPTAAPTKTSAKKTAKKR
jgi:hypothetical protein